MALVGMESAVKPKPKPLPISPEIVPGYSVPANAYDADPAYEYVDPVYISPIDQAPYWDERVGAYYDPASGLYASGSDATGWTWGAAPAPAIGIGPTSEAPMTPWNVNVPVPLGGQYYEDAGLYYDPFSNEFGTYQYEDVTNDWLEDPQVGGMGARDIVASVGSGPAKYMDAALWYSDGVAPGNRHAPQNYAQARQRRAGWPTVPDFPSVPLVSRGGFPLYGPGLEALVPGGYVSPYVDDRRFDGYYWQDR